MKVERHAALRIRAASVWSVVAVLCCAAGIEADAFARDAQADLTLAAKSSKPVNKVSAPASTKAAVPSDTVWTPSFSPLFKAPVNPPRYFYLDTVGGDPSTLDGLDLRTSAAATRAVQIRQMDAEMKLLPVKSPQALSIGLKLVKLYEEQALYLENLRASGGQDKNYADLNHAVKSWRSKLVGAVDNLLLNFPKSERALNLKATQLISRIKLGDPTVRDDALRFVGTAKNSEQQRVANVGILYDFESGRTSSSFGSLEGGAQNAVESRARAGFKYYLGEIAFSKKQYSQALAHYNEAVKELGGLKNGEGKPGALLSRLLYRIHNTSLLRDPINVDGDVVQTLQSAGALEVARHYCEQIALNNLQKQPGRAAKIYSDVQTLGDYPKVLSTYIEMRILDIHLASRDLILSFAQWQRMEKDIGEMGPALTSRIFHTQKMALALAQTKADGESVARFVSMHDFFVRNHQIYASREDWVLKVIEVLWKARRAKDVAARADALAGQTKSKENLLAALRFALRARESLIGLTSEPRFLRTKKLAADEQTAQAYVVNLDKMQEVSSGRELEQSQFQAVFVTQMLGQQDAARQRFETVISKYPQGPYSGEAMSFFIEIAEVKKDWLYVEKLARLGLKLKVNPAKAVHKNLRVILENAVYSHAQQLSSQGQFEAAANKFVAFQREFPSHPNGATALDLAAKNFLQAKKTDAAITQMESLLKSYPNSGYAKESVWQAAELSRGIAQFLRASKHYEDFARKYQQDGAKRSAWLRSAEMHKSLGRFANAVAHYENYLAQVSGSAEKLKIAKEIADIHFKFGRPAEAIASYERIMKYISNSDDELYLRSQILVVQERQGLEAAARKTAARMLSLKASSQEGYRQQAKAKFIIGKFDAPSVRGRNIQNQKELAKAIKSVAADYEKTKTLFLAACEVPELEWCSAAYYEVAKMAEEIAKTLLAVELPPTLNPSDVNSIRTLLTQTSDKLNSECKSFAAQAEQALSSGAPDAETAERIRSFAQQMRGESADSVPMQ